MNAALLALAVAGAALFAGLLSLSRGSLGAAENALRRGLSVLFLLAVALRLLFLLLPPPPPAPTVFLLVESGLLRDGEPRVRREVTRAAAVGRVRVASFEMGSALPSVRAAQEGPRVEARFSGIASALAWAALERAESGGDRTVVLARRSLPLPGGAGKGVSLVVVPAAGRGTRIRELSLPDVSFAGRALRLRARVPAGGEEGLRLQLFDGERPVADVVVGADAAREREMVLEPGRLSPGVHLLRADLVAGDGSLLDRRLLRHTVRAAPTVAYVHGGRPGPLAGFLARHGYPVRTLAATDYLRARTGLAEEVLLLDDLPPALLGWDVVSDLYREVAEGRRGLLVVGGGQSFGPGGYGGAPIERLLPLWMGLKHQDRAKHTTALLAIIDTSTSMLCPPEGCPTDAERMWGSGREARGPRVRKIDLARQALLNLVPAMREVDSFGILGGRVSPYWILEFGPLAGRVAGVEDRVRSIEAGGSGIHLYSSLLEARRVMAGVRAEVKHIVVLADTDDIDEIRILGRGSVEDLVRTMGEERISLSFVGLGFSDDRYVPLLNRVASSTGGYLYLTSDVSAVPSFLLEDRERLARDQLIRRRLQTVFSAADLPGVAATPDLEGQFITEAKDDAWELVWSEIGYPVSALRRIGRGGVAALAADSGAVLAPAWVEDDALPLWDGLVASLLPDGAGGREVFVSPRGRRISVYLTGTRRGDVSPAAALVVGSDGSRRDVALREVFPGIGRADLGEAAPGAYRLLATPGAPGAAPFAASFDVPGPGAGEEESPPVDYGTAREKRPVPPALPGQVWLRAILMLAAVFAVFAELLRRR